MTTIQEILQQSKTIAIVARYLQSHGYRVVAVNPTYAGTGILGEKVYASLQEAAYALSANGQQIDVVDCFRKSGDIPPVAREAIAIRARVLWMQMDVVMDRCIKIEHVSLQ